MRFPVLSAILLVAGISMGGAGNVPANFGRQAFRYGLPGGSAPNAVAGVACCA